jgi:hypothetical protein
MYSIKTTPRHIEELASILSESEAVAPQPAMSFSSSPQPHIPEPTKPLNWKRTQIAAVVVVSVVILAGLAWKLLAYLLVVLPTLLTLGHFFLKDWHSYKPAWKRWPVLCVILLVGIGAVVYQSHQLHEKAATEARNQANTNRLQGKIEALVAAQKQDGQTFTQSFGILSGQLADLRAKVVTEGLHKEMTDLQAKLDEATAPTPRASLTFTFPGFKAEPDGSLIPLHETTLEPSPDGVVTVPINIFNLTETNALDGHVNFTICDGCTYAKEPKFMVKVPTLREQLRDYPFAQILSRDSIRDISLDVTPPKGAPSFQIGMLPRCKTCSVQKGFVILTINVRWPYISPKFFTPSTLKLPVHKG